MAISASELQNALVRDFTDDEESLYPPYWFWNELSDCDPVELEGIGRVESILTEGGEGQGEKLYMILRLTTPEGDEQFFRADGYYSSYDGRDWDGAELYAVRPVQKTITVYE